MIDEKTWIKIMVAEQSFEAGLKNIYTADFTYVGSNINTTFLWIWIQMQIANFISFIMIIWFVILLAGLGLSEKEFMLNEGPIRKGR